MNRRPLSPCLNCARRELGCHGKCQDYAEFKAKREEIRQAHHKEWEVDDYELKAKRRIGWRRE